MAKQDKATREKILSGLKSEVLKAKKPAAKKVVEQVQGIKTVDKNTIEPIVEPTVESTEPIVEPTVEPTVEPIIEPTTGPTVEPIAETLESIEKPLTLFSNFTKKTEEDLNKSHIETVAENLLTQNVTDEDLNPDEDSPEYKRIMAEAEATGGVEVAELIMCVLCMWLSGDWSQKAFETYKILKEKKKVIIVSLVKIAVTKKKKSNPTWGLTLMILSASAPMLVIAFMARIAKNREKEKEAEYQKVLAKNQLLERQRNEYLQSLNPETVPFKEFGAQQHSYSIYEPIDKKVGPLSVIKTEKRGRHKRTCASQLRKGAACDCK